MKKNWSIFLLVLSLLIFSANKSFSQGNCSQNNWAMEGYFNDTATSTWSICPYQIGFTITVTSASFTFYYTAITIVQNGKQFEISSYPDENEAKIHYDGSDDIKQGVTVTGWIDQFPSWFNIFSPFRIYYSDDYIDVNGAPVATTTTPSSSTTTTIPQTATTTISGQSTTTTIFQTTTTTINRTPFECEVTPVSSLEGTLWKQTNRNYYIGFYRGFLYIYYGDTSPEKGFIKYGRFSEFGDHKFLMRYGFVVAFQINILGNWQCDEKGCWMDAFESIRMIFLPLMSTEQLELVCSDWSL